MNWVIDNIKGWFKERKRKGLVSKVSRRFYRLWRDFDTGDKLDPFLCLPSSKVRTHHVNTFIVKGASLKGEYLLENRLLGWSLLKEYEEPDLNLFILDTCTDFLDGGDE